MKKWIALCLSLVMVLSCCGMAASAEERSLGVMLSTNIMSLDTNLATDGESFEVIADCVDGLMQMDADGAASQKATIFRKTARRIPSTCVMPSGRTERL